MITLRCILSSCCHLMRGFSAYSMCLGMILVPVIFTTCCGFSPKEVESEKPGMINFEEPEKGSEISRVFRGADWLSDEVLFVIESSNEGASIFKHSLRDGSEEELMSSPPISEPIMVRVHPRQLRAIGNPFFRLSGLLFISWNQHQADVGNYSVDSPSNIEYAILSNEEYFLAIEAADVSEVGLISLMSTAQSPKIFWETTPIFDGGVIRNDLYISETQKGGTVAIVRWLRQEIFPPEPPDPTYGIAWCLITEKGMIVENSFPLPEPTFTYRGLSGTYSEAYTLSCGSDGSFSVLCINHEGEYRLIDFDDVHAVDLNGMVDLRLSPDEKRLLISTGNLKAGQFQIVDVSRKE